MQIWNTYSGKKENLEVPRTRELRVFTCGPTVYNYVHIGNMRTYSVFDTLVRWLRFSGIKIFYLQNITDIDDKIIRRAHEENKDWKEIARTYEHAFHEDEKKLNIQSVTTYARASFFIKEIVRQVQTLIAKGHAYEIPGDGWYFDVTTFPDYGKLAKRTLEMADDGVTRIDESVKKRNRADFCLWKFSKAGEPIWNASIGKGRPGWHIEDTAISEHFFGPQYDLHGAGVDLIFPHHEAEIAQQESASGKRPFVKYWMHVAFFDLRGEKMSKSKGNLITVRNFLKSRDVNVFRYLVASHHYRTRIEYDESLALQATQALGTIQEFLEKLNPIKREVRRGKKEIKADVAKYERRFTEAMDDDLNTPQALAALFNLIAEVNKIIWNVSKADAANIARFLRARLALLGILLPPLKIPLEIRRLAAKRELSRRSEQFTQADDLRRKIESLGWKVDDTPRGPLVLPS